ncbi:MAG: hypothetical protein RLZ81_2453 [Pseudomonadota bacterium]|jgi:tRNA 5-methylaminomethyl-2-thiouridine biosynthesis bifunctional protein
MSTGSAAEQGIMQGTGLPGRWQQRDRFVILEAGFGRGDNFLATWAAWQADPLRCDRLVFIALDTHPLGAVHPQLASQLQEGWTSLTPGFHTFHFDEAPSNSGRLQGFTLLLGLGQVSDLLPGLIAQVDAFCLEISDTGLLSRLNRLAAPGATLVTKSTAPGVREALLQAGFVMEATSWRYAPRYTPAPLPGGMGPTTSVSQRHAIVVGAGLAGASAAWALCRQGWRVTIVDRQPGPAQGTSGNPGGLFHSVLHAEDSHHARLHRAAALATWRQVHPWMASGRLQGQATGLIRLDADTTAEAAHAQLTRLGIQAEHVSWLDQEAAQDLSGLPVPSGGWLFPQGGWLHPAGYVRCMLEDAGELRDTHGQSLLECLWLREADHIQRHADGNWQLLDNSGSLIAAAPTLVLACAHQSTTLLRTLPAHQSVPAVDMTRLRGQVTMIAADSPEGEHIRAPKLPVAGNGYVLPLPDGSLLCGATVKRDDLDPTVRAADHRHNLGQAHRLGAWLGDLPDDTTGVALPPELQGRTGWRAVSPDRLPMIGALPWSDERLNAAPSTTRLDQVRMVPRERDERGGLYIATGLGSRGITWTALAGELLAHWVTGSPCPIEIDLRDALDPARFQARARRT